MNKEHFGTIHAEITAVVRPCREKDLPALEWMGLFSAHRMSLRRAFEAQERGEALLLLAMRADFPIAQVFIDFAKKHRDRIAQLWAIRTFYPLQGAGIGGRLLTLAEDAIRRRGITRAELGVEVENEGALRFYERHGWRRLDTFSETVRYPYEGGSWVEVLDQWLLRKDL